MSKPNHKLVDTQESGLGFSHDRRLAHYQQEWSTQCAGIQRCVERGMPMQDLVRLRESHFDAYDGFVPSFMSGLGVRLERGRFSNEIPPHRLVVVDGCYVSSLVAPSTDALIDVIARCVEPDVDCIVEFGSGLGFNLARLRLRLPAAPVTYIACEPTEAGRHATRAIFSTDPAARLQIHPFDYCQPNFDFLSGFRKIVAFTAHSIEQISVLGEKFYRMLLDAKIAACVHIEPVGWQRFTNIAETAIAFRFDDDAWNRFYSSFAFVLDDARVVDNAAVWSTICDYNIDLLRLISSAAASGEISVTKLAYDVVGLNPFNPSTLVSWRRNRASG
jgi:hypothetical protein